MISVTKLVQNVADGLFPDQVEVEPFLDFENILRTGLSFPSFSLVFGPFVFWKLAPCWEVVLFSP